MTPPSGSGFLVLAEINSLRVADNPLGITVPHPRDARYRTGGAVRDSLSKRVLERSLSWGRRIQGNRTIAFSVGISNLRLSALEPGCGFQPPSTSNCFDVRVPCISNVSRT